MRKILIGIVVVIVILWAGGHIVRTYFRGGFPCSFQAKITLPQPRGVTPGEPFRRTLKAQVETLKNDCRTILTPKEPTEVTYLVELTYSTLSLTLPGGGARTDYAIQGSALRLHEERAVGGRGCRFIEDTKGQLTREGIELVIDTQVVGTYEQCRVVRMF